MNKVFNTAEELMDHLKKQIVSYSSGENIEQENYKHLPINPDHSGDARINLEALINEREANNVLWNVTAEMPITSHRKLIGKFIVYGKKIVRKMLRWYVSKTFEKQSSFNGSVTRSINEVSNILITMKARIDELEHNQLFNTQSESQHIQLNNESDTVKFMVLEKELQSEMNNQIENLKNMLISGSQETDRKLKIEVRDAQDMFELGIQEIEKEIRGLFQFHRNLEIKLREELSKLTNQFDNTVEQLRESIQSTNHNIWANLGKRVEEINGKLHYVEEKLNSDLNFINHRVRKIDKMQYLNQEEVAVAVVTYPDNVQKIHSLPAIDFDYLWFENKYRGSQEDIAQRQSIYLPYFKNHGNVLDIGCGRGEFLGLLLENEISAIGIDTNLDMIKLCEDLGLPVKKANALSYLNEQNDASLGGIFLGQVIEHISFDDLLVLVTLSYRKLKPGAYLIMETPNPQTLAIFNRSFYLDPTHVKPVHPLTVKFVAESTGFREIELNYSGKVEESQRIPLIVASNDSIVNLDEVNKSIERLNETLYGYQDYAIIAKK
jgi:O-antigen chain-terminating methyltransferase